MLSLIQNFFSNNFLKEMHFPKQILIVSIVSVIFLSFFTLAFVGLDPDYGWHIGSGRYVMSHGIPATDPFSYTMPSFPFIDHEWLTNVLLSIFHNLSGKVLAALAYTSIIGVLPFILFSKVPGKKDVLPEKTKKLVIASLSLLFYANIVPYFGIRPQVISWLFLSLFLMIFLHKFFWEKYKWFIPVLLVLWVNLHGSFALGIVTLLIFLCGKTFRTRKVKKADILIFILAVVATWLNPYGPRIWDEVRMQVTDTNLRFTIIEWFPLIFFPSMQLAFFIALTGFLVIRYFRRFVLEEQLLILFFGSQALLSARHFPLYMVVSLPLVLKSFEFLYEEVKSVKFARQRYYQIAYVLVYMMMIVLITPLVTALYRINGLVFQTYPMSAVDYLKTHDEKGNLFSTYNWGGYLIQHYPERKVFIDGRMPSWRWDENPTDEADWAFREYTDIVTSEGYRGDLFDKYNIDTVLWKKEFATINSKTQIQLLPGFIKKKLPYFSDYPAMPERLEKEGWKKIYEDDVSIIYTRR